METSTTSDIFTGTSDSITQNFTPKKSGVWIYILVLAALFGFLYYFLTVSTEHMSGGTLTQLFANDMQDTYLKGNVDQLATGNFLLHWNQPTRIASGYGFNNGVPNRGQLLSTIPSISVNPSTTSSASSEPGLTVNTQSLLNSGENTPFPWVNPKSTVSPYPGIKNILINQKNDIQYIDEKLDKEKLLQQDNISPKPQTLINNSTNSIQSSLVNACQSCTPGSCANCPVCTSCLNSQYVKEGFDSGLGSQVMPSKMHEILSRKLIKNNSKPYLTEKFDSDSDPMINLSNNLRADTGSCANCPEARCINCPIYKCPNNLNCPLGFPCSVCKRIQELNSRDQIADYDDDSNKEDFQSVGCPCRRKVITATDLNVKKFDDEEPFSHSHVQNMNSVNAYETNENDEHFESVGFDKLCPCSYSRCTNCSECRAGKCPNCARSKVQDLTDKPKTPKSTYIDLASFGNWEGGYRLGTNWNNSTTGPSPIDVTESLVYYPDSYVGSYFINPKPDIAYPYAVIPPSRTVAGLVVTDKN